MTDERPPDDGTTKLIEWLIGRSSIGQALARMERRAERAKAEARRRLECTCEPEHSITKLGHCRSCPHHNPREVLVFPTPIKPGCPPRHADGTPHNFEWATYEDDTMSTGVCSCGHTDIAESLWEGP